MKQKPTTIILFISLLLLSKIGFGQLFMQNFSSSGTVSDYVSATPNNTQFTNINASAGSAVSIIDGRLDFTRTIGGEGVFSRSTSFSAVPTTLMVQFNLEVINSASPVSSGCLFKVGNGLNDLSTPLDANGNIFARFGINFTGVAGQFRIRNIDGNSNSIIFTGQQTITFVMNQSNSSLTYSAPDGTSRMLNSGFYDVWVGASIVQNAVAALTSSVALANFKFNFRPFSDNQSIRIDNLYINSLGGSLPSNTFSLGTDGDFQSITNAGGVFNVLNNLGSVATGGYNFQVAADLTAETGVNPLNQISGMSNVNQVKIVPTANGRIVSGSGTLNPLINFNGADFVSIDGGNGGTITGADRMTIRNTVASGATFQFINDATNHTITDCIIESNSTSGSPPPYTGSSFLFSTGTATGNDNISVSKCIIRNRTDVAPANPRLAINSTGSSATIQNDNITFDACEFINFFASVDGSAHIAVVGDNTTNFTLKNSSIYQATTYNTTSNVLTSLIRISGTNTNNITIDGNFFGGRLANCGGTAYIYSTSVVGGRFRCSPILSAMATGTTLTIQNNTFKNIQTDFYEATTAANSNQWLGISGTGRMFIRNNTFSNLRFSIINGNASAATTPVQAISYLGDGAGAITANTIEDVQFSFAATPATPITNGFSFDAIRIDPTNANLVISQNTIGSTSTANSILCNAHASVNAMRGINVVSANNDRSCNITKNTIANMTHNGTSASISSELVGIKSITNSNTAIVENNINRLTSALQIVGTQSILEGTNTGAIVGVAGINVNSNSNYQISNNKIHSLSSIAVAGTGANACGILLDGGVSGTVDRQIIYNIRNSSGGTTPAAAGIISRNLGGSMLIYNNMIGLGLNTNGTPNTEDAIYIGFWNNLTDGDKITFIYNSIAIAGSITNGTKNSYGFLRGNNAGGSITTPMQVLNNLFYNQRQELGAGSRHFAIGNQGVCGGWGGCGLNTSCPTTGTFLPNYNAFFSINTATVGEWLGASQDFASWKTSTVADDKSVALASGIIFTNIESANLHISNSEFRLNALALPLYLPALSILTDIDGDFRRGTDIGADEIENNFEFTGAIDNNWNNPANWIPNGMPTCADIVLIPTGKSVQVYGGTNAQCYRLLVENSATLTLENNTAILEQCWLKGTTGTFPAPIIAHEGDIQMYGTMNLNDGTLQIAGNFIHNGTFNKGTSTVQMNLDRPIGNTCITDYINYYNASVASSDILNFIDINFQNLNILNAGVTTILGTKNVTVGDATTKLGILDITDGSTFIINGNKLTIEGILEERTGTITGSTTSKLHILGEGDLVGTLKFTDTDGNTFEDFQEVVINRIDGGGVKGLAALGNVSLQISNFLDLTAGILKTGTVAACASPPASGGDASLEVSVTNPDLTNSVRNFNAAGYASTGGWVWGNLRRAITGTGLYSFPLGDGSRYELFDLDITEELTGTNNILGYFNLCDAPHTPPWTASDVRGSVTFVYNNACTNGYWRMSPNAFGGGKYDVEIFPVDIICAGLYNTIGKSVEGAGVYSLDGSEYGVASTDIKRIGYTSFSDFSLITTNILLPVNLLSFNALAQKNSALISWETVWEKENDYFEVQKSIDGKTFFTIGTLKGKGTSSHKNSYQLSDNEPYKGVNYYRLKQVDTDGKVNYSKIISLYFQSEEDVFTIFPNPSSSLDVGIIISSRINNILSISVLDALGKSIWAEKQTYQGQMLRLKSNMQLAKGIYLIIIHDISTGKINSKKLIIE